jgi:hypothetical protein
VLERHYLVHMLPVAAVLPANKLKRCGGDLAKTRNRTLWQPVPALPLNLYGRVGDNQDGCKRIDT